MSFLRKQESFEHSRSSIPACAGMTQGKTGFKQSPALTAGLFCILWLEISAQDANLSAALQIVERKA